MEILSSGLLIIISAIIGAIIDHKNINLHPCIWWLYGLFTGFFAYHLQILFN